MPSIPQSLLWISLVVLWLFVLVPMLVSKRETVRRTSDAALATRVLNGGRATRLLRRHGPAAGHHSDPDWRPSDDELDDHDLDEHDEPAPKRTVVLAAAAVVVTEIRVPRRRGHRPRHRRTCPSARPRGAVDEPELQLDLGLTEESNPPTEAIRTVAEADFEADEIAEDVVRGRGSTRTTALTRSRSPRPTTPSRAPSTTTNTKRKTTRRVWKPRPTTTCPWPCPCRRPDGAATTRPPQRR